MGGLKAQVSAIIKVSFYSLNKLLTNAGGDTEVMFVDSSLHLNDLRWSGSYLSWTCENISFQSHKLKYLDTDLGQIQATTMSEI